MALTKGLVDRFMPWSLQPEDPAAFSQSRTDAPRGRLRSSSAACWGITEGAAGMISQVKGLAQSVGLPFELRDVTLRFPWKKMWPGFIPVRQSIFRNPEQLAGPPCPRLVVSCGRQAVMASLFLKRQLGDAVFTVHIQDPKIRTSRFDLVIAPEHDGLTGRNVFQTRGAVHHISRDVLAKAAASARGPLAGLHGNFVTVLLGGPNSCYRFDAENLKPLIAQLREIFARHGVPYVILPSRRTPGDVVRQFQQAFPAPHLVWDRSGENPYLAALGLCSHVIATSDSVSMISEAAATEKPVYVYPLPVRRRSRRFARFHESFSSHGITRPLAGGLENWTYESPNVTHQIAALIRGRIGEDHVTAERSAA